MVVNWLRCLPIYLLSTMDIGLFLRKILLEQIQSFGMNFRYTAKQTGKIGAKNLAFVVSRLGATLLFASNHYGFWIMWNEQGNVKLGVTEKLIEEVRGLWENLNFV